MKTLSVFLFSILVVACEQDDPGDFSNDNKGATMATREDTFQELLDDCNDLCRDTAELECPYDCYECKKSCRIRCKRECDAAVGMPVIPDEKSPGDIVAESIRNIHGMEC